MKDPDVDPTEAELASIELAREQVDSAIRAYIQAMHSTPEDDDPPYVQGWVVAAEFTSVSLERQNKAGREAITPFGQMIAIGAGLGAYIKKRFT